MAELNSLDMITEALNDMIKKFPEIRRVIHEEIGTMMKSEIDREISSSGFSDGGQKIKGFQEKHIGSGGGYAAVRPKKQPSGREGAAAITVYNERGHKIREPKNESKRYRPKIKVPYVNGRHFYENAKKAAADRAVEIVERSIENLTKELEQ